MEKKVKVDKNMTFYRRRKQLLELKSDFNKLKPFVHIIVIGAIIISFMFREKEEDDNPDVPDKYKKSKNLWWFYLKIDEKK